METLDYTQLVSEIEGILQKAENIVFSTCADNRVTGRTMCHVNDGLDVMFGTGGDSLKVQQARQNNRVALVCGSLQMEAVAELWGAPSKHAGYNQLNDVKFPWMKSAYPLDPNVEDTGMLVICHPTKVSLYKYIDGQPHWDVLDVEKREAYRL